MADNERIRQKYFELAGEYGLKPGREATSVDSVQELGRSIHNSPHTAAGRPEGRP